jgi:hypothetical protein
VWSAYSSTVKEDSSKVKVNIQQPVYFKTSSRVDFGWEREHVKVVAGVYTLKKGPKGPYTYIRRDPFNHVRV